MYRNSRSPEMRAAYYAVPPGWLPEQIRMTHTQLGGQCDLNLPASCSQWPEWHQYREILYRIADGISAGDAGCTELATRYLILNYSGSYAGYLRALFARRLKHRHSVQCRKTGCTGIFLNCCFRMYVSGN